MAGDREAPVEVFNAKKINVFSDLDLANSVDITLGGSTGSKIGQSVNAKIGLWGVTPVVQPADSAQAAGAAYGAGANGLDSEANMQALHALVIAMRTALVNAGLMKGSA